MMAASVDILRQLECCLAYWGDNSRTQKLSLEKEKKIRLGASSNRNTTGTLRRRTSFWRWCLTACGGTKQRFFINSKVTATQFLASDRYLFSVEGVCENDSAAYVEHMWLGDATWWNNEIMQWSGKQRNLWCHRGINAQQTSFALLLV